MIKHCDNCGKAFETISGRKRFCSTMCKEISWSKDDYPDGNDYIVCKECGIRGKQLVMHIRKVHHMSINFNKNYEYEVLLEDNIHRYFLDFYIEDNNKAIEFDGDYWHGEKRGNQKRDKEREEKLKQLGFTHIFHVKERDYRTNPQKTINECIEFIRS